MKNNKLTGRLLGGAFLLQAMASLISGAFLMKPLISPEDISATMVSISGHVTLFRAALLLDTITAMGIIWLGSFLYTYLKKENKMISLTALGLYIFEAALLGVSKIAGFMLLSVSLEFTAGGNPAALQSPGSIIMAVMDYSYNLHLLPFCAGALLFYILLYKSALIPRGFSLWGILSLIPLFIGTVLLFFDIRIPFALYIPYVPFEFFIGIWILLKGVNIQNIRSDIK